MAVLEKPLSLNAVQQLRGIVDVYTWKGLVVARAWPQWRERPPTEKQAVTWNALRDMFSWKKANPVSWQTQWENTALPVGRTYEDMKRKQGLTLAYADALIKPPDIIDITLTLHSSLPTTQIAVEFIPYSGFNPIPLTFYVRTYDTEKPPMGWVKILGEFDRQGNAKLLFRPDVQPYAEPILTVVTVKPAKITVTIPGHHPNAAIFPTQLAGSGKGLMIGAPYYSSDYP